MALSAPVKLGLLALGVGGLAALASSSGSKPTPDPFVGPPKPDPIDVDPAEPSVVTDLTMTSLPTAGPVHVGTLMSDATWTIATESGLLVVKGTGEVKFLDAWATYANGSVDGVTTVGGVLVGFDVRKPPCAPGFPTQWCYRTTWPPRAQRHVHTRYEAIKRAIARARAGG